jgi:hypothetical protein
VFQRALCLLHEPRDFRSQGSHQEASLFISAPVFPLNVQRLLMLARFPFKSRPVFLGLNKLRKSKPRLPSDNSQPDDYAYKRGDPTINSPSSYRHEKRHGIKCIEEKQNQKHREQRAQPGWEVC